MNVSNKEKTNVLVLLSGGIDSASCTHFYKTQGFIVETLFIDYGQKSLAKEAEASQKIAKHLSVPFYRISLIESKRKTHGELVGRNASFLFLALMEFRQNCGIIGLGLHQGTPYYDCSEDFVRKTQVIFDNYTNGCIKIGTPFLTWSKVEIFNYFNLTGIPSEMTYSCEQGENQPCGACRSCKDLETFYACKKH